MEIERFDMNWSKDPRMSRRIVRKTVQAFLDDDLCYSQIANRYFFVDVMRSKNSYLYHATDPNTGSLLGFAVVKREYGCSNVKKQCGRKPLTWFVTLVCGKQGSGVPLMKRIETDARKAKQRYVQLTALIHVVQYYHNKLGYKLSYNCTVEKDIATALQKSINGGRIPMDIDESVKKLSTKKLILKMLNHELGQAKDAKCKIKHSNTKKVSKQRLMDCSVDGFVMTLCLNEKKVKLRRR